MTRAAAALRGLTGQTRAPRVDREGPVHRSILHLLQWKLPRVEAATLMHATNELDITASPKARQIAQGKAKSMGMVPGWPDLQWCGPGGQLRAIEIKAPGNKPTDAQFAIGADIVAAGGLWAWATSIDEATDILRGWGYRV